MKRTVTIGTATKPVAARMPWRSFSAPVRKTLVHLRGGGGGGYNGASASNRRSPGGGASVDSSGCRETPSSPGHGRGRYADSSGHLIRRRTGDGYAQALWLADRGNWFGSIAPWSRRLARLATATTAVTRTIDLLDYAEFTACMAGPGGGLETGCAVFDFDSDVDVDAFDSRGFRRSSARRWRPRTWFSVGAGEFEMGDTFGEGQSDELPFTMCTWMCTTSARTR